MTAPVKLNYVFLGNLSGKKDLGEYPKGASDQVNNYFLTKVRCTRQADFPATLPI